MRKSIICLYALALFVVVSCTSTTESGTSADGKLKGNITISGAFALYPLTVKWAEEFKKIHPDVIIDVSAGGAGKGMVDVLSNMVDVAMFSRGLKPEESSKGAWPLAVSKDAVVATINIANPLKDKILENGITKQQLAEIFLENKYNTWGELLKTNEKSKINVFTRSDACGAGEMWGKFFGKSQENLKGVQVFGDPGIASAVKGDRNSIGYNNVGFAYDIRTRKYNEGIMVVPIDLNADGKIDSSERFYDSLDSLNAAIKKGIYPEPPSRDLYLITKGKPENKIVKAFMEWILTDGQKFVDEAGYVKLTDDKISAEQQKLK